MSNHEDDINVRFSEETRFPGRNITYGITSLRRDYDNNSVRSSPFSVMIYPRSRMFTPTSRFEATARFCISYDSRIFKMLQCASNHRLTIATMIGIGCGATLGIMLKYCTEQPWDKRRIMYFHFPGEIFLRIVNMSILPLVVSSIVSASCNLSKCGSMGVKALYYYSLTTTLGIMLSVILSQTIRPGELRGTNDTTLSENFRNFITTDIFLDLLRNLFADNIPKACLYQYQTILIEPADESKYAPIDEWKISSKDTDGTNILGLVMWSLLLGIATGNIGDKGKPLVHFFHSFSDAAMTIMDRVTMLAPIGVVFLIPGKILEAEDLFSILSRLSIYVLTVFVGLMIHGVIVLPLVYFAFTRKSPFNILRKIGPAIATACGTSSSTATVPMTIRCLDEIGINPKVSRFVAPLGATINMDGIALYETVGAIFIIQLRGLDISLIRVIAISITCTVSCIGAAGLPTGGYMMLILVLESIGIPANDVMLIIAIDCLVDRFRTTVNIIADALAAGVIEHLTEGDDLAADESNEIARETEQQLLRSKQRRDQRACGKLRTLRKLTNEDEIDSSS